jgi:uncharacterized membrane protein HdeD (DUF308 family)
MLTHFNSSNIDQEQWLKRYYYGRALFSIVWVVGLLAVGTKVPTVAAVLLVAYPAWDAGANWVDAASNGGLAVNRTQGMNVWVSGIAALAVALALHQGMNAVTAVRGVWATVSGLLQLSTALRRWKSHGAQWAMVLSGAQSALAGGFFVAQSRMDAPPQLANIAGYAGVGAFYFLISGIWLTVSHMRRQGRAA